VQKNAATQVKDWLVGTQRYRICGIYVSAVSSLANRRSIRVYFDGTDWIHVWRNGAFVSSLPAFNAPSHVSEALPLFTREFTPSVGDTIIDVGAGVGSEIQAFSQLVGATGQVIAIEADPAAFRQLEKLTLLLKLTNVQILNVAIGDSVGLAHLTQDGGDGLSNHVVDTDQSGTIAVPMSTLDTVVSRFALQRIDFIKMNIEGAESQALAGFQSEFRKARNLCISCHDFLGVAEFRTQALVEAWLAARDFAVTRHPDVSGKPWMGYYIYAARNE
jgi:FkbM family methyltransferase